jgi:hypothetical protein
MDGIDYDFDKHSIFKIIDYNRKLKIVFMKNMLIQFIILYVTKLITHSLL